MRLSAPPIRARHGGRVGAAGEKSMARVTYAIVEHDGGWADRVDSTFSETFRSREAA